MGLGEFSSSCFDVGYLFLSLSSLLISSGFKLTFVDYRGSKSFFGEWFHWLDATVIIASFAVDVVMLVLHGNSIEEIAELIIVLRLWRLIKIIEELSVGMSEGMGQMRERVEELERENLELKRGAIEPV